MVKKGEYMIRKKPLVNKLLIFIPVLPLLDMFITKESPLLTIIGYLIILIVYGKKLKINYYVMLAFSFVFIVFASSVIAIISGNTDIKLLYYLIALLFFTAVGIVIGRDLNLFFNILRKMVYFYAFLNTVIYVSRMIMYDFSFSAARANMGIYGGNSAHFILFAFLLILKKQGSKDYIYFLTYTLIHSIMFVSKGAILMTVIWITLDVLNYNKSKILNKKFITLGFLVFLIVKSLSNTSFGHYVVLRFNLWSSSYSDTGSVLGTRGDILEFVTNYIAQNINVLLFGVGPTVFQSINPWGFSNAHNLPVDILIDTGIFSLVVFLGITSITFIKSNNRWYYFLCIMYATVEGVALFYTTNSIVTGYAYMFILILYLDSTSSKRPQTKYSGSLN